jgi:uncharacterized OsmC-like protein
MAKVSAKVFEYATQLDRQGQISAEGGEPVALADEWTPENMLLAALLGCLVTSLRYYARAEGIRVMATEAAARGVVTLREETGLFGLISADVQLDVELAPAPEPEALSKLLARTEAGCFVSNSLAVEPSIRWRVNSVDVVTAA